MNTIQQLDLFGEPSRNWEVKYASYPMVFHGPEINKNGIRMQLYLENASLRGYPDNWYVVILRWNYNKEAQGMRYSFTSRRWEFGEDREAADQLAKRLEGCRRFAQAKA